jgi:hypothetical protein
MTPTSVHWRSQAFAAAFFFTLIGRVSWYDQAGRLAWQRVSGAVAQPEQASSAATATTALPKRIGKESRP